MNTQKTSATSQTVTLEERQKRGSVCTTQPPLPQHTQSATLYVSSNGGKVPEVHSRVVPIVAGGDSDLPQGYRIEVAILYRGETIAPVRPAVTAFVPADVHR